MNLYRFMMATRACFFCLIGLLILQVGGLGLDIVQGQETLSPPNASVWQVASDGSGQFTLIQEAIDQATSGDTILIKAGTPVTRF
jgi:hypothetical protein